MQEKTEKEKHLDKLIKMEMARNERLLLNHKMYKIPKERLNLIARRQRELIRYCMERS